MKTTVPTSPTALLLLGSSVINSLMSKENGCFHLMATRVVLLAFAFCWTCLAVSGQELNSGFYADSCPQVESVVRAGVHDGASSDSRLPASLLRLEFHDCFVNGCDGSILLDDTTTLTGEKNAGPNQDSVRGFDVIDNIKSQLESECPVTVSCADILAIAARDAVVLSGGPSWDVRLGRRDSLSASTADANQMLPSPSSDVPTLISKFQAVGLSASDMVILSGAHSIGLAKCSSFKGRLFDFQNTGQPDENIDPKLLESLQELCPSGVKGDGTLAPLDEASATEFDASYFSNLQQGKGLLQSDQVLYSSGASTQGLVDALAHDQDTFFDNFAQSMVKMQSLSPLTGTDGEIRSSCRFPNSAR